MKTTRLLIIVAAICSCSIVPTPICAQGTAFIYQGRLNNGTNPATGSFDLRFALYDALTAGTQQGNLLTNSATGVTNGLFTVPLDFGPGIFNGRSRWLEIGVRTNRVGSFMMLAPRQSVMPEPYSIFANTASNVSGTLPATQLSGSVGNGQLANSTLTVNAGTGLSGGGTVALGGSTTLNNAGLISVAGNADITASTTNGAVTLGDTATSANTPNTIVKRDGSGAFSAGSLTVTGAVNLVSANSLTVGGNQLVLRDGGLSSSQNVGIGVSVPLQKLHVAGNIQMDGNFFVCSGGMYLFTAGNTYLNSSDNGEVVVGSGTPGKSVNLVVTGDASTRTLTIRGGSDIAEPFHISTKEITEGSIVIIDEENPGQLKLSDHAYDKRVAGIVSGANGVHPGLSLSQQGVLEGGQNVALSGRVYALADASNGAIIPGDLLTTSSTPGYCMKATNSSKAQGAMLGKAMSALKSGKGMVLVLVTLQ